MSKTLQKSRDRVVPEDQSAPQDSMIERNPQQFSARQKLILAIVASVSFTAGIVAGRVNPELSKKVREVMTLQADRTGFRLF